MTYQELNNKIYKFYIDRSVSFFFTLCIDEKEIEEIISVKNLKSFQFLKSDWNNVLETRNFIPQYFGILAIQCLAASLMQNDGEYTANSYQIRLQGLLDIKDNNTLQNLFRGTNRNEPVQEEIWYSAKRFLKDELGFELNIPRRTTGRGRFVQYPISQALLNTEDLRHFTSFFDQEFQVKEALPFNYFKMRLDANFLNISTTTRTKRLWENDQKRDRCLLQLYNYYNSWEGDVYVSREGNRIHTDKASNNCSKQPQQKLLLLFERGQPKFYINGEFDKEIKGENLFQMKNYNFFHKTLIIFNESDYPNEYQDSRFMFENETCYIFLDINLNYREFQFLENNSEEKIEVYKNYILYKYAITKLKNFALQKYFAVTNPVRLSGGLKTYALNEYLAGYGPSIIYNEKYYVLFENKRCEYHHENSAAGKYKIRTDYYKDVEFTLTEQRQFASLIETKNKGWNLNTYCIEDNFSIEGCSFNHLSEEQDPIRNWIEANLSRDRVKKYNSDNVLIKVINNYKK